MDMNAAVRRYMSEIGRRGGKKSRRVLLSEKAREMVLVREARRVYARFQVACFWSFNPQLKITLDRIPWVIERLRKAGGMEAWDAAIRLNRMTKPD